MHVKMMKPRRTTEETTNREYYHGNHKLVGVLFVINQKDKETENIFNAFIEKYSEIFPPNTIIANNETAEQTLKNLLNFGVIPLREIPIDIFLKAGWIKTNEGKIKLSNYISPSDLYNLSRKLRNKVTVIPLTRMDPDSILFHFILRYIANNITDKEIGLILHRVTKEWLRNIKERFGGITLLNPRKKSTSLHSL